MWLPPPSPQVTGWEHHPRLVDSLSDPQCVSSPFCHKFVLRQGPFQLWGCPCPVIECAVGNHVDHTGLCSRRGSCPKRKRYQRDWVWRPWVSWSWLLLVPVSLHFSFHPYDILRMFNKSFTTALWSPLFLPKILSSAQHQAGLIFSEHMLTSLLLCS